MAGKKTVIDGITFDSELEASIYQHLKGIPAIKIIKDHHTFNLQEGFEWFDFKHNKTAKIRPMEYTPDLILEIPGHPKKVALEVKGFERSDYVLRKKLFINKYRQEYDFIQIDNITECEEVFGRYREQSDRL
jgi:hypothetical protein